MKKILLILVLSLLAVYISFNIFVQEGQTLMVGGAAIHEQEDWEKKYYELMAQYEALLDTIEKDILPKIEDLRSSLNELRSELDKKVSELENMKAELASAKVRISLMESQLNTRTIMMYAFIVTTVVFVATTLYFALRRPKALTLKP